MTVVLRRANDPVRAHGRSPRVPRYEEECHEDVGLSGDGFRNAASRSRYQPPS
jgi:hypothetical protein